MPSRPSPPVVQTMGFSAGRSPFASTSDGFASSGEQDGSLESAYPSPTSAQTSPADSADHAHEAFKDAEDPVASDLDPASGPHRSRSASHSSVAGSSETREKRKRSRVTPEQLAHLERLFAVDRSPTAARRKEISEMLGMQERQTQIWFQNRRAKAKLQESRKEHAEGEIPPELVPTLTAGSDAELYYLVHEEEPISVIPCIELTIGSWKRIVSGPGKYDLVAYACDTQKRLTWYIYSSGQGFKMEVPFSTIVDTKFMSTPTPGMGQASFILSRPPLFYLETLLQTNDPGMGSAPIRTWKRCQDWTEAMQASTVLQHDLVGAAVQLAHVLRNVAASTAGPSIPLYPPSYHVHPHGSPAGSVGSSPRLSAMAEQSPLGPSQPAAFGYVDYGGLRRRFSTPSLMQPHSSRHIPTNSLGSAYPPSPLDPRGTPSPMPLDTPGSSRPSSSHFAHGQFPGTLADDFPRLPISQTISRRSFAEGSANYGEARQVLAGPYGSRTPLSASFHAPQPLSAPQSTYGRPAAAWESATHDLTPSEYNASDGRIEATASSGSTYPHGTLQNYNA